MFGVSGTLLLVMFITPEAIPASKFGTADGAILAILFYLTLIATCVFLWRIIRGDIRILPRVTDSEYSFSSAIKTALENKQRIM
jgi:hypothetical protein